MQPILENTFSHRWFVVPWFQKTTSHSPDCPWGKNTNPPEFQSTLQKPTTRLKLHNLQNDERALKKFWEVDWKSKTGCVIIHFAEYWRSVKQFWQFYDFSRAKTDLPQQSQGNLRKNFWGTKGNLNFRKLPTHGLVLAKPPKNVARLTQAGSDNVRQTLGEPSAFRCGKTAMQNGNFAETFRRTCKQKMELSGFGWESKIWRICWYFIIPGDVFSKTKTKSCPAPTPLLHHSQKMLKAPHMFPSKRAYNSHQKRINEAHTHTHTLQAPKTWTSSSGGIS